MNNGPCLVYKDVYFLSVLSGAVMRIYCLYLLCVMSPEPESDKGRGAGAELPDIRVDGPQGTRTLLRDEAGEAGEIHRVTTNT